MFLLSIDLPTSRMYFSERLVYHYFKGRVGQLTSNPTAIKDLRQTIGDLRKFHVQKPSQFLNILLLRQLMTVVRRGDLASKLLGVNTFFWLVHHYSQITFRSLAIIKDEK